MTCHIFRRNMTFFESLHVFRKSRSTGANTAGPRQALTYPKAFSFLLGSDFSASAPFAARFSNGEAFLFSTDLEGVSCVLSMILNFFSKKVHKKLAKRYTRFARVRTPTRGVDFRYLSVMFNNYAEKCVYIQD